MKKVYKCFLSLLAALTLLVNLTPITVKAQTADSLAVLLLGIDTGAEGRTEKGRSDVVQLLTLNPDNGTATLTSIPRDTYVEIPGYGMDKINHAYAYGEAELAQQTVENLFGIEIDHYMVIDMAGIQDLVDAVGGIEVTPPTSFSIGGYDFVEGQTITLDGNMALQYARERYTSGGDYARQERQRDLIMAVLDKVDELRNGSFMELAKLGMTFNSHVDMSLSLRELASLAQDYLTTINRLETYQLQGVGETIDGVYYDIPTEDSLYEITTMLNEQLGNQ